MEQTELKAALASLAGAAEGEGGHPGEDELMAYAGGDLAAERSAEMRRHLAVCPPCTELLLDLEPFATAEAPAAGEAADFELASAWRRFEQGLEAGEEDAGEARVGRRSSARQPWPYALAAAFFAATLGLSLWVGQLSRTVELQQQELAASAEPRLNLPIHYLDATTRGAEGEVVELAASDPMLVLILTPADPRPWPGYLLAVLAADGETLWQSAGLEASTYGTLRIGLPTRLLPAGRYRLRLTGVDGERVEEMGEYPLEVRYRR